ncbi:MAG: sigma-70 family RNA polymerase sigma factor [Planctomycetota bacterium]
MVDTHGGGSDLARLWDPLVRANLEPLRAYIENLLRQRGGRREKSPETTDDLLQETFLTAWKRRDRFDGDDQVGFLKWTKVIAFYTASAFLRGAVRARKSGRREVLFSELGGSPPARRGGPRPAPHEVEEEELEARRAEALRALDAEELELVELVYVSEKPVGDVAKDRAVTAGAVRKKLQRMFGRVRRPSRRLD